MSCHIPTIRPSNRAGAKILCVSPRKPAFLAIAAIWLLGLAGWPATRAASVEGIALAIVYDTSGSMLEQVKDASGQAAPKYHIANRALGAIINRLEPLTTGTAPRRIHSGLVVFSADAARVAVPFGPLRPAAMRDWLKAYSRPQGSTPLGDAVRLAGEAVLASHFASKHVLVITDGINTRGVDPVRVLARLGKDAERKGANVFVHFVAFDVDANAFDGVKKLGATVVGAADEKQLNSQLEFILEEKILLEAEEPPAKKTNK